MRININSDTVKLYRITGEKMKHIKSNFFVIILFLFSLNIIAQQTNLKLPTNDNSSSFNVTKNNGSSVFKVDGSGRMTGDGSGLSNVKPLANTTGGNQLCQITKNYAWYQDVRHVTLTTPSSGKCFVMASGYIRWESKGWDLLLSSILRNSDPNSSWNDENEFFKYLNLSTDYNCSDSSDQYVGFAQHRVFNVGSGTQTFTLWANKYSSSAKVRVDDVNISVIFIPTSGTGSANLSITSTTESPEDETPATREELEQRKSALKATLDGTINGRSPDKPLEKEKLGIETQQKIKELEDEVAELKRKMDLILNK